LYELKLKLEINVKHLKRFSRILFQYAGKVKGNLNLLSREILKFALRGILTPSN
jgi:hypothetical protein